MQEKGKKLGERKIGQRQKAREIDDRTKERKIK